MLTLVTSEVMLAFLFDSCWKTKATAEGQKIAVLIQRCLRSMNLSKREKSVFHKNVELDRINFSSIKRKQKKTKEKKLMVREKKKRIQK